MNVEPRAKSPLEADAASPPTPRPETAADDRAPPLIDATSISRNPHHGPTTTWNGFKELVPNRKIDHIFVYGSVRVEQHAILADHWDGKWPSDHLPVMAEIALDKSE